MAGVLAIHGMDLIDMFWVGRIGPESVAAVALFLPVYLIFLAVNGLVGTGSVTLIGRAYGAGNLAATAAMIRQNFYAKLLLGSLAGILGYLLLPRCLAGLGADAQVTAMSLEYGRVLLPALGLTLAKFTCFTSFRCTARPRLAMYMMLGAVTLNMILDPCFIFGWGLLPAMGLRGAAIASVISSFTVLVLSMAMLAAGIVGTPVRFLAWPLIDRRTMGILARVGIPAGVNNLLRALAATAVMAMVTPYGTVTVAVFGVAHRIMRLGVELSMGFGLGLASLVGQSLGANRPDQARRLARYAIGIVGCALLVITAGVVVMAGAVSGLFFDDPAMIAHCKQVMRVLVLAAPLLGTAIVMNAVFSGAGYTLLPSLVRQSVIWLVVMPLIWLGVYRWEMGPSWIWNLIVGGALLQLLGELWLFRHDGWERWGHRVAGLSSPLPDATAPAAREW